jgi:hypothetical protein
LTIKWHLSAGWPNARAKPNRTWNRTDVSNAWCSLNAT